MSSDISANNKRIAKNTLVLYFRMFFTIVVGLYTSRVILNALGFVDYGIYSVVGGVVTMLTFLNVGMIGASQRFISYELGKGNFNSLKKVYGTSLLTHLLIGILVFLLLETIGLWFVNTRMNIPSDRIYAANWVFQCSLITFLISIMTVPFNSCIIAHEKMGVYSYVSIFESVAKLLIAYAIISSPIDRLIYYALLLLLVHLCSFVIYIIYCNKNFTECTLPLIYDKTKMKEMFSFAFYGSIGNIGFSFKDQGSNIILNLFFGTTINAARGIATQVNGIINGFASNFTMAMNPQIIKSYASGDFESYKHLSFAGSRYAFFLLSIVSIPFIVSREYILLLWLGSVPEYTDVFVTIILIASVIYSMSHTISTAIIATGKIKKFQISLSILLLSELPISYMVLLMGYEPYVALLPMLVTNFLSLILRIRILHNLDNRFLIKDYLLNVIFRCVLIFVIAFSLSILVGDLFPENILSVVLLTLFSVAITIATIYILGFEKHERFFLKTTVKKHINRIIK